METPAPCPYCRTPIDPAPKRSRKCPHCRKPIVIRRGQLLTERGAEAFDARLADERAERKARERVERFREARRMTADQLRQDRESGVVAAVRPLVSSDACRVCLAVRGKVFPIDQVTLDMVPPYANCELEGGCESTIVEVLTPEYGGPRRRARGRAGGRRVAGAASKRGGCLTAVAVLVLFGVVLALWR